MAAPINRKQLAELRGVSLPTIDSWVRRGCPVVTRGGPGKAWAFNPGEVAAWCDRFLSRGSEVVANGAAHRFSSSEKAETVKALGHLIRHVGPLVGRVAVEAGAPIPSAYALEQVATVRLSIIAEAYLAEHGVTGVELVEMFTRPEDDIDWQSEADAAGLIFDAAACDRLINGLLDDALARRA